MPATQEEYLHALDVALAGDVRATISVYEALVRRAADGPAWIAAGARADLAGLRFATGDAEGALALFADAVRAGFCDCVSLFANPALPQLAAIPRFRAAYAEIRLSAADLAELQWIHREIAFVLQEVRALVLESGQRADDGPTSLPQLTPTRAPQSPGVLAVRAQLGAVQAAERALVYKSDTSRITLLMQRSAIGGLDPAAVERSRAHALQRAQERDRAARERLAELDRLAALSTDLAPAPPLR